MKHYPKSTWFGAALFDLVGLAASVAALTSETSLDVVLLVAGVALLACSGLLFVMRTPALLLAGLTASGLVLQFAPLALSGAGGFWPASALVLGGAVVLFFASAALGGTSAATGGC